ncbi:hypothetical protein M2153_001158 [Pseudomonas sp. JUb96]|nr:hypothetical protein [Pseudomonas sp. JUb96]
MGRRRSEISTSYTLNYPLTHSEIEFFSNL